MPVDMSLRRQFQRLLGWMLLGISMSFAPLARAAVFDGGALKAGFDSLIGIQSPVVQGDLRSLLIAFARAATGMLGLLGVISLVIAGIYLIVGMGSDTSRETAKRIALYTIVGLLIVSTARLIVETTIALA